jgi:hypothetical protein
LLDAEVPGRGPGFLYAFPLLPDLKPYIIDIVPVSHRKKLRTPPRSNQHNACRAVGGHRSLRSPDRGG